MPTRLLSHSITKEPYSQQVGYLLNGTFNIATSEPLIGIKGYALATFPMNMSYLQYGAFKQYLTPTRNPIWRPQNRKPAKNNISKLVLQLKIKLQRLPLHFVLQLQIKLQRLPLYFRPTKTGNGNNF